MKAVDLAAGNVVFHCTVYGASDDLICFAGDWVRVAHGTDTVKEYPIP